jgi:hypothetical protein
MAPLQQSGALALSFSPVPAITAATSASAAKIEMSLRAMSMSSLAHYYAGD